VLREPRSLLAGTDLFELLRERVEAAARGRVGLHQYHRVLQPHRGDHGAVGADMAEPVDVDLHVLVHRLREALVDLARGFHAVGHVHQRVQLSTVVVALEDAREREGVGERGGIRGYHQQRALAASTKWITESAMPAAVSISR